MATIDYYLSLNSPWTYLGGPRLAAIAKRHGAQVRVKPVNFGTIFPQTGGLPLPKRAPARQAYRLMELERWRRFLDMPLTLHPRHFPSPAAKAAGLVVAAGAEGGATRSPSLKPSCARSGPRSATSRRTTPWRNWPRPPGTMLPPSWRERAQRTLAPLKTPSRRKRWPAGSSARPPMRWAKRCSGARIGSISWTGRLPKLRVRALQWDDGTPVTPCGWDWEELKS